VIKSAVDVERGAERILTTHAGSLPRPPSLVDALRARQARLDPAIRDAVAEAVERQARIGIDVVSDGEMGKPGFTTYVEERLTGFGGESPFPPMRDLAEFPEYAAELYERRGAQIHSPRCEGPVAPRGSDGVERDVANLRAALGSVDVADAFVPAASPGVIVQDFVNAYYPTRDEYLEAVADAMRPEYRAIVEAGFVLQVDCPDLAMGRHLHFADLAIDEFRREIRKNVDALNGALEGIPPDRVRVHVCWGNYPGPHHRDVPLREIVDVVLEVNADGVYVEGANPRHAHEWTVFEDVRLPDEKVLVLGVIDTLSTHIEHPELVAERIERLARIVGRERVVAATDCGFGTFAGVSAVHPTVAWAKLEALVEGARIASERLW
jgi:5-methyltetrahydropteroyltriglutamate--homocysteine methyltransferase